MHFQSYPEDHTMSDQAAGSAGDELRAKAEALKEDLKGLGAAARDAAQEKLNSLRGEAEACVGRSCETLEERIRQEPLKAVLIAAGVGFVVGYLWARR